MIPAAMDYVRADSAEAAVAALAEHGEEAKLLAGGQSLIPLMRLRLATPAVLVDVGRASDLVGIAVDSDTVSRPLRALTGEEKKGIPAILEEAGIADGA